MEVLSVAAFYFGVVAYSVASTLFFVALARPEGAAAALRWAPWALGVGAGAHGAHLLITATQNTAPGSLQFAISLCALITAAAYLFLRRKMRIDAIGVVVSPLALTFLVGAQFLSGAAASASFPRTLLKLHIFANFLGVGLFLLAGAAGAFYLFQERRLKEKRITPLQGKLPALDSLDSTEHRLLLAGFPLLTFGVVTGAVFAAQIEHMTAIAIMRSALAYATWLLVAGVLVLRAVAGWRGRRAAYGTLAGVGCVMLVIVIYVLQASAGGQL